LPTVRWRFYASCPLLPPQNDLATTEDKYFEVIRGKTAALFSAACEVGGVIAGRGPEECAALASYGMDLGMAFQLIDDALDYSANAAELGKTVGDDFREGKLTYPVLLAIAGSDTQELAFWQRTVGEGEQTENDLAVALELIARQDAIHRTVARAQVFAENANRALAVFAPSNLRETLRDVTRYTAERRS
jgi:octaprenyl-diphosphate synthase